MARSLRRLVVLLLIAATLAVGTAARAQPAGVEEWVGRRIAQALAGPGQEVEITGTDLTWTLDLSFDRIVFSDEAGPWLRLEDVVVDWSPLGLVRGAIRVDRLSADQAVVLRLPAGAERPEAPTEPAAPGQPEGIALPSLPLAIDVRELAANVVFAPGVLGPEQQELRLAGRGGVSAGEGRLALRLDEPEGGPAAGEADIRLEEGQLAIDLALTQPIGGILSQFLQLPGLPAMDVNVQGKGPLTDWQGTFTATAEGRTCLQGSARSGGAEVTAVTVEGRLDPQCLTVPELAQALSGGPLRIAAEVAAEEEAIRVRRLSLDGEGVQAALSGVVEGERLNLDYTLQLASLSRLEPFAGVPLSGEATITGTLGGTLGNPVAEMQLDAGPGAVAGSAWRSLDARLKLQPVPAEPGRVAPLLVAAAGNAVLASGVPEPLEGPVDFALLARVQQAEEVVRLADLRVSTPDFALSVLGVLESWGEQARLHLTATGRDLGAIARMAGLEAAGRGVLHAAVSGDLLAPRLGVAVLGRTRDLRLGVPTLDALIGNRPVVRGAAAVTAAGVPRFRATIQGADIVMRAEGMARPDHLAVGFRARLPRLEALELAEVSGQATLSGLAFGAPASPQVALRAEGRVSPAPDFPRVAFQAAAAVRDVTATPTGALALALRGRRLDAAVSTDFALGDTLRLDDLEIRSGDDVVTGALALRPDGLVVGNLRGRIDDLGPWSEVAGTPLGGSLRLQAALSAGEGQELELDLSAQRLDVAGTRIGRLSAEASIVRLFSAPRGRAELVASSVATDGTTLERLRVAARGDGRRVAYEATAEGRSGGEPLAFEVAGSVLPEPERAVVVVDALRLGYGRYTARLAEPATTIVVRAPRAVVVEPTTLTVDGGRIVAGGRIAPRELDFGIRIVSLPIAMAEPFVPGQELTGQVSGEIVLSGSLNQPTVTVALEGQGLSFAAARGERIAAELRATWRDQRLDLAAVATGAAGSVARLEASLPLVVGGEGLTVPETRPLQANLQVEGQVERLAEALPLAGQRIAGQLAANISVTGTLTTPELSGRALLTDGLYENFDTGTVVRNLLVSVSAPDPRSFVIEASGTDGSRGRVTAEGVLAIRDGDPVFDFAGRLDDFRLVRMEGATALASGAWTLAGTGQQAVLAGDLVVDRGEIALGRELLGDGVPDLEVVEINRPETQLAAAEAEEEGPDGEAVAELPFTMALDLRVGVQRLFVRGQGLDSEWQGRLAVGGTASDPRVVGQLRAVRGAYDFIGRTFRIARGTIAFDGGPEIDPMVDVVAEAQAQDITAQVVVAGPLSDLGVEFTSTPPYPRDEILSRLLFGRQLGRLTVAQQVQLARAAASLAGGGAAFDPVGRIRGILGLDVLEVGAGETEEGGLGPTVTVGKYLGEDTFVRLQQDLEGSSIAVEQGIGGGFSVETELGERTGGAVGLNWRLDY